ncbi:MAG: DUF4153 domain-containing protein [Gemmatimonadota bacterium]
MSWFEGPVDLLAVLTGSGDGGDLLVASSLAIPLYIALRLAQERGLISGRWAGVLRVGVAAVLIAIVWQWNGWSEQVRVLRYVQMSLGAHLLVAFFPFVRRGELNGFWQYNRSLFLRVLITGIYSAVLFAGLAIALLAIEQLFGVDLYDDAYMDLFLTIGFVFTTWFFLAGVPEDIGALESVQDYPRGLKLFAQFVLIPLVTIYLTILTAYFVKVLVTTEWPSGWIGWLVSSVSVAGILSILLTHPIRGREENRWIASYGRWFWIVMIPAIGMLLAAIWKRIDQYGVTEPRYFLVVLTLWLAAMAVLYGIVRSQNIKLLPLSLCALAFVTVGGPWGAYQVSRNSQTARFTSLLESNGMLEDGRAVAAPAEVSLEDRRELSGALTYLLANYGVGHLTELLGSELAVTDSLGGRGAISHREASTQAGVLLRELGVSYVAARRDSGSGDRFTFRTEPGEALPLDGYDYSFRTSAGEITVPWIRGDSLRVELDQEDGRLDLKLASTGAALLSVPLGEMLERANEYDTARGFDPTHTVPRGILHVDAAGGGLRVALFVESIHGSRTVDGYKVDGVSATWLIDVLDGGTAAP